MYDKGQQKEAFKGWSRDYKSKNPLNKTTNIHQVKQSLMNDTWNNEVSFNRNLQHQIFDKKELKRDFIYKIDSAYQDEKEFDTRKKQPSEMSSKKPSTSFHESGSRTGTSSFMK